MKNMISSAYNKLRASTSTLHGTLHAEVLATKKLPYIHNNKKRKKKVNLLVIKVTKSGKLANSKPCFHCIKYLNKMSSYQICNVYYSTHNQTIVKIPFSELLKMDNHYISRSNRRHLWKNKI